MDWVTNIVGGLIVAALIALGGLSWRSYKKRRNPLEWRFERNDGDTWEFKYFGRRDALVVEIYRPDIPGAASVQPEIVRGVTYPINQDVIPNTSRVVNGLVPTTDIPYHLNWIDERGRRSVSFKVSRARNLIEIHRKDSGGLMDVSSRVVGD